MKIYSLTKILHSVFITIIMIGIFQRNICRCNVIEHQLCLENIATNLKHPTTLSTWPIGNKLLVSEHAGRMFILAPGKKKDARDIHKELFLDITDRVLTSDAPADERGLLSFALHPDFIQNRYLYVCYSATSDKMDHKTVISRFDATKDNLEKVNKNSEKVILEIQQPGRRQNGGQIFFGLDNYLYITTGDGGDLANKRFLKDSLLGKILRIDVQNEENGIPYIIPADNPFVNETHSKGEIYAYGFRNPWRCTVDQGDPNTGDGKGRIICGDNGEEEPNEEEIDLIVAGGRYGWIELKDSTCKTLKHCRMLASQEQIPPSDVIPLHIYSHSEGQAVVGGVVYRGDNLKSLYGVYIYADFVHGTLHYLNQTASSYWSVGNIVLQIGNTDGTCVDIAETLFILGLSADHNGEIIVMTTKSLSNSSPSGALYRLGISDSLDSVKAGKTNGSNIAKPLMCNLLSILVVAVYCLLSNLGSL